MNTLILKLGATGDVVRTSPLLRALHGSTTWVTSTGNQILLRNLGRESGDLRVLTWDERDCLNEESFDLTINLEDEPTTAGVLTSVRSDRIFGAYLDKDSQMAYTPDSRNWFDMSLISSFGREKADALKFQNRRTYQELLFEGLGFQFSSQSYLLPPTPRSDLQGDIAIAAEAGPVWPMKKWAYYEELKRELENQGLTVNYLPKRSTLLQHLADVRAHRCLVSGDSLPMHLALGSGVPAVALFTCTSPWEIHDYGILQKIVSPLLGEYFYKRAFDRRATTAISVEEVLDAVGSAISSWQSHQSL